MSDIFPDSKIAKGLSSHRTKLTAFIKNSLGKDFNQTVANKFKPPEHFCSIIMSETTDKGSAKQCAVAIYFDDDDDDLVKTRFLCSKAVSNG